MTTPAKSIIIVTGMSGAGRSTAANVFEDQGWFVTDNLPPQMLPAMAELVGISRSDGSRRQLVAVVDARSREFFDDFHEAIASLRESGWNPEVIYLEASDEALVRRFESVRRPHPLQGTGRLLEGIRQERTILAGLRSEADIVIDTSSLNVHKLSAQIRKYISQESRSRLQVNVLSFGFKYGLPLDSDLVFDMRFLPNPFWNPELREFNGTDKVVADFVLAQEGAADFLQQASTLITSMLEGFEREGRSYVTIAIGCTGGKHRSVAMSEALSKRLNADHLGISVIHRDLGRE